MVQEKKRKTDFQDSGYGGHLGFLIGTIIDHVLHCPPIREDGTSLLTYKEAILKRWAEHFDGILNRPSSINDEAINRLPQVECNPLLDEFPSVSETVKAIKLLSSSKALGSVSIPSETYTAGGPPVAEKLTELFHIM